MSKYIIKVAPLIPLPFLRTQIFSYWFGENLPIGSLVSIPFYFREAQGIVIESVQAENCHEPLKLKNINLVIEKNLLSKNQIELAKKIADYYLVSVGSILKLMVPKIVKTKSKKSKKNALVTKKKAGDEAKKISGSSNQKILLIGSSGNREKISIDLVWGYVKKNKQCLILVPEIFFARSLFEKMEKEFSGEIALIHSRITKGQYYDWWKKIKSGEIKIVISTKIGIFLPFSDLGLIFAQEEQDLSFKQWKAAPRYNAIRGAEFLAEISGAKLVLASNIPSVQAFYSSEKKEFEILWAEKKKYSRPKFEIISPKKERNDSDFPISRELYDHLAKALNSQKKAFIFVNQRGFSSRTICENCKKTLKCPKCDVPLVYSEENGQYRCLRCAFKMDLFASCPSCGGFRFSHRGIGTQTIEKKMKKLFPSAQIAKIDSDSTQNHLKLQKIMENFSKGEINILVGTQSVIKGLNPKSVDLAAAVSGRDFVENIEPDSRNLILSRFYQMEDAVSENGNILLQTFFVTNPLFDFFRSRDILKYISMELAIRKRFGYPPFMRFIKLSFADKIEKKTKTETRKMFSLLETTVGDNIEIIGPYKSFHKEKKGLYKEHILIKINAEIDISETILRSVLGGLHKGWITDVDPAFIF